MIALVIGIIITLSPVVIAIIGAIELIKNKYTSITNWKRFINIIK